MFYDSSFNQNIGGWNVSKVTNMIDMFKNTPALSNENALSIHDSFSAQNDDVWQYNWGSTKLDDGNIEDYLKKWKNKLDHPWFTDVKKADNAYVGHIADWDVSEVTDMNGMFRDSSFNQNIGGWNVSKVTDMSLMFKNTPFNQNIGGWNVSKVKYKKDNKNNNKFKQKKARRKI